MRYVVKLVQAKFSVDLVGKCFLNSHTRRNDTEMLKYRFYLSFIDGHNCSDYVTDQIWTPLRLGIVPIVFGPSLEDLANLLPHNSFVYVNSSTSPKRLVSFLQSLEQNEEEYRKYLQWRIDKDLDQDDILVAKQHPNINLISHHTSSGWTRLCEKYYETNFSLSLSVSSIAKFALNKENRACLQ